MTLLRCQPGQAGRYAGPGPRQVNGSAVAVDRRQLAIAVSVSGPDSAQDVHERTRRLFGYLTDNQKQSFWTTVPGIITAVTSLISAIGVLIGSLVAAGVIGGDGGPDPSPTTAAETPTTTAESIVFTDDFDPPDERRWDVEGSGGRYTGGAYQISVARVGGRSSVRAFARSPESDASIRINVDVRRIGGTANEGYGYGIFCRGDGPDNRYAFTMWAHHSVIDKFIDGRRVTLRTLDRVTAAVPGDETVKKLQALCATVDGGVDLQFWIEDKLILRTTDKDSPLTSGTFGLHAVLGRGGGNPDDTLELEFDNFEVSELTAE